MLTSQPLDVPGGVASLANTSTIFEWMHCSGICMLSHSFELDLSTKSNPGLLVAIPSTPGHLVY